MKLYKITNAEGKFTHKETEVIALGEVIWASTQADARHVRMRFEANLKELPSQKRPRVEVEEVDVPTNKAGLLKFLNAGCK